MRFPEAILLNSNVLSDLKTIYVGKLKDECGLPLSCVIEPFKRLAQSKNASSISADIDSVGRCTECYA